MKLSKTFIYEYLTSSYRYRFNIDKDIRDITEIFDANFYRKSYSGLKGDDYELARHYITRGWRKGLDPAPSFSTLFYLQANPDVQQSGINPLLHFVRFGKSENRAFSRSRLMDQSYEDGRYQGFHGEGINKPNTNFGQKVLASIFDRPHPDSSRIFSWFDFDYYQSSFAKNNAPNDLVSHYLRKGWKEGRDPAPWFSTRHYLAEHKDVASAGVNPFVHYCNTGLKEGRKLTKLGRGTHDLYQAHQAATSPGPHFEEFDPAIGVGRRKLAKVLAFYLPQFHAVKVNDLNWGQGFTEWRNLSRALPRFRGHIQPRVPRDIGFYDLSKTGVMQQQIKMAREAGIHGFCFYHYWFDGVRALEAPMESFLADQSVEFPFCLMWTNENWTRTWDGAESDIIMQQSYDPLNEKALIADFARHMNDARYIRISGKPLMFIYRPGQIPDAQETINRWRAIFEDEHDLSPLIFMAQGFGDTDPRGFGLDGAIEFPPHKLAQGLPPINAALNWYDEEYKGHVFDYDSVVERSLAEQTTDFPLIKTATPSWDNEARRPGRGMVLHGATPKKFEAWVSSLVARARTNSVFDEPMICINAWNEWCEGAVLEPDVYYGGAFLNALSRAVHGAASAVQLDKCKVLIVGHDANQNGAQTLALELGRCLRQCFGVEVNYLLNEAGPLQSAYETIGTTIVSPFDGEDFSITVRSLRKDGYNCAIANTTASGLSVPVLKREGITVTSLIHELPNLILSHNLEVHARLIADNSDHVVFPAKVVQKGFEKVIDGVIESAEILPQGLYNVAVAETSREDNGVREELGLPQSTRLILGVGYADFRKGIDRFVSTALSVCNSNPDYAFVWVGDTDHRITTWLEDEVSAADLSDRVLIIGHRSNPSRYFAAADLFYLSSREDPFPSVVLEAFASGLPVVGHKGCGGCDTLISRHGKLVDAIDPLAAPSAILEALAIAENERVEAETARRKEISENFQFETYAFRLLQKLVPELPTVSVVVPNYNYAPYIGERLHSIFDQSHPIREVIVLDDASSDNSVQLIQESSAAASRKIQLHVNDINSGSPFPQWCRGVELAKGDYVWIAEADDVATPDFVSRLVRRMEQVGSDIGFCDARQIDESGSPLGESYRNYINEVEPEIFYTTFDMDGVEFLDRFLSVKNIILNVSGVLFRRNALLAAIDLVGQELPSFKVAGDWRLYLEICAQGGTVSYLKDNMNVHRRHSLSSTHSLNARTHIEEIQKIHKLARKYATGGADKKLEQELYINDMSKYLGLNDPKKEFGGY